MNTRTGTAREDKSQPAAHDVAQKKSVGGPAFQFVDNRPEAVAQRRLWEAGDGSLRAGRVAQLRSMAGGSSSQGRSVQRKENNTGLPDGLKSGVERLSGYSLDDVKVHRNSDKPAQLRAHAYAQGTDIHLGPGQEKHLPHEAWHVVQQKQGRVRPTMQMKGGENVNDDAGLEREADLMGGKVSQMASDGAFSGDGLNTVASRPSGNKARANILQRKAGHVPSVDTLTGQASRGLFGGEGLWSSGNYEAVLSKVGEYHDAAATPDNDYGRQIIKLEEILGAIGVWEGTYGSVNRAVPKRLFGRKTNEDKRRPVLKDLKTKVNTEDAGVRGQGKQDADAKHGRDRTALLKYVDDGAKSDDRRLKNSCEWIRAGKTVLYAVTPTGDSYARLLKGGKDPQKDEAFFPTGLKGAAGDVGNATVSYNEADLRDNANVLLDVQGKITGGWNQTGSPGVIAVVTPSKKNQATVWETLRHEVQHDSDKHKGRESLKGYRDAAEMVDFSRSIAVSDADDRREAMLEYDLTRYKTEYRAYSYQEGAAGGRYSSLDNSAQDKDFQGYRFSERQLAIFKHIYRGYKHTKDGWDNNGRLYDGTRFRAAVVAYWDPDSEGFNKYNSARVDDFYIALDNLGTKQAKTGLETTHGTDAAPVDVKTADPADPLVLELLGKIRKLDEDDLLYIKNESPAMRRKVDSHLAGVALQKVKDCMDGQLEDYEVGHAIASMFE
ncbi:hypothetical protein FUAX_50450 (plasmid) [Fulvitalea axinellae]|uniref:eCIS core domain-containing protein n=1 Tax=Fulvitalea axinellae TaxID=1182444 RepID=A0AAU9CR11_9BACT|nr:hypothetical protein FUAX_50450 [Fulvitalea axinellae]